MNRCDDIRELMSARMDGVLDPAGEKRLSDHLASCAACREDLAALERTLQALHALPPVKPPPDLTARIRARIRAEQQPRRSRIIEFLNLPQTRVALAASLLLLVTTLGIRQMLSSPRPPLEVRPAAAQAPAPVTGVRAAAPQVVAPQSAVPAPPRVPAGKDVATEHDKVLREKSPAIAGAPAAAGMMDSRQDVARKAAPAAEALKAESKLHGQVEGKRQVEAASMAMPEHAKMEAAAAPKAMNAAAAAAPASYRPAEPEARDPVGGAGGGMAAHGAMLDAAAPASGMIAAKPAASSDRLASDKLADGQHLAKAMAARSVAAPGRTGPDLAPAPASAPPRPVSLAPGAAPYRMRSAVEEQESAARRRSAADGYTFRTERSADAAAIVNRYAAKSLEPSVDGTRVRETALAKQDGKDAQPITMEVTLAASDLPALLEELRRAGAQLVAQPAADTMNVAAPGGATRAGRPAGVRSVAATATAAASMEPSTVADADSAPTFAAAAAAPARITVRFTFLPPAQ